MYKYSYTTLPEINNDTKDIRKKLKLLVTKQLVYKERRTKEECDVLAFEIEKEYNPNNPSLYWSELKIYLSNKICMHIHSDYFSSMQKPSFYKDMDDEEKLNTRKTSSGYFKYV